MPETGAAIGTPACWSDIVEPHTEPIDDEPLDSSVSEIGTDRVREVLGGRDDRLERALRERPVADVAADARLKPISPTE